MFCKNCGSQVPEGVAFCAACGTPVAAAPAAAAPAAAAPVAAAPAASNPAQAAVAAVKNNGTIKLIAIIAAIAIVLGLFIGLLGGGSAKSVAKKYVMANLKGDIKAQYELKPGKYVKYFEEEGFESWGYEDEDDLFDDTEEEADDLDVKVKVKNFNQYYKAEKKITKADDIETYGKGYKYSVKVVDMKDMRNSDIEDIQDMYDTDEYEDYINVDKIKKGKKVYVKVDIDANKNPDSYILTVYCVKYGGKWTVAYYTMDDRDKGDD